MEQRYKALAEEIRRKASRLEWTKSNYVDSFELPLGKGLVVINNNSNRMNDNPFFTPPLYALRFLNERGETVHSIEADGSVGDANKTLLEEIYDAAYNAYMQTEETYQSMIDDLAKV